MMWQMVTYPPPPPIPQSSWFQSYMQWYGMPLYAGVSKNLSKFKECGFINKSILFKNAMKNKKKIFLSWDHVDITPPLNLSLYM